VNVTACGGNGESKQRMKCVILGINSAYHEPSVSISVDGEIIAAAEEERFNRMRHGKVADLRNPQVLPVQSIKYCLAEAGISPYDLTHIGYSFSPEKRLANGRNVEEATAQGRSGTEEGEELFYRLLKKIPLKLGELLGVDVRDRFRWIDHHCCHAASAYFGSAHDEAAIMSLDGIGEVCSTWLGRGVGNRIEPVREILYPNSLGFLWTKVSRFLGYGEYGQWKVMALGAYGDSKTFYDAFRKFVSYDEDGNLSIDGGVLQFRVDSNERFEELLGSGRAPDEPLEQRHYDVAAALQRVTDEAVLSLARYLKKSTGSRNLCYAGGVALNCLTNRVLVENGPFESVFIQPAANDAGTSLGACYYLWHHVLGNPKGDAVGHTCLGPSYSIDDIDLYNRSCGVQATVPGDLASDVAGLLADGKTVVLYQDRMEFGPRALGNRSILADPRRSDMPRLLNERIKQREFFRPFAASVLEEHAVEWFDIHRASPAQRFMLLAYPVCQEKLGLIPAVTHVDGTTRIQAVNRATSPLFHDIIEVFHGMTGIPMLLNTSFNDNEPIICTPENALETALRAGLDYLVMEDRLVDLEQVRANAGLAEQVPPPDFLFDRAFAALQASDGESNRGWISGAADDSASWRRIEELMDLPVHQTFTCR